MSVVTKMLRVRRPTSPRSWPMPLWKKVRGLSRVIFVSPAHRFKSGNNAGFVLQGNSLWAFLKRIAGLRNNYVSAQIPVSNIVLYDKGVAARLGICRQFAPSAYQRRAVGFPRPPPITMSPVSPGLICIILETLPPTNDLP